MAGEADHGCASRGWIDHTEEMGVRVIGLVVHRETGVARGGLVPQRNHLVGNGARVVGRVAKHTGLIDVRGLGGAWT